MAHCPHCNTYYREPEDEQGDHPCPKCGRGPGDGDLNEDDTEPEDAVYEAVRIALAAGWSTQTFMEYAAFAWADETTKGGEQVG